MTHLLRTKIKERKVNKSVFRKGCRSSWTSIYESRTKSVCEMGGDALASPNGKTNCRSRTEVKPLSVCDELTRWRIRQKDNKSKEKRAKNTACAVDTTVKRNKSREKRQRLNWMRRRWPASTIAYVPLGRYALSVERVGNQFNERAFK